MSLWPLDWYAIFCIVTFVVASIAVRAWRDLGVYAVLIALLVLPWKWLGPVIGVPALAEDAVIRHVQDGAIWQTEYRMTAAFVASAFVAALIMLAWKHVATSQAKDGSARG